MPLATHRNDDESHVGGDVAVLVATRVSGNRKVSGQARAVSVVSCNVS